MEIATVTEIKMLVDTFYNKVRQDDLLAEIFEDTIGDRWGEHLEKMYRFWQTVLLAEHTYYGSPFSPHASLPVNESHFERWITLFYETVDEHFEGEKAEEAKWRAGKMAEMFLFKIKYHQSRNTKSLL